MGKNDEESKPLVEKAAPPSAYAKFFLQHINPSFGEHFELAFRGAMFVLICGSPFILKPGMVAGTDIMRDLGWFTPGVAVYFIYTLYLTTGQTLYFAWGGILGTLLATIDIWVMYGFFPTGVTKDSPDHVLYIGLANGILFVAGLLFLNFDLLTQIFALCTFVWYWMAFMEPGSEKFSKNFTIRADGVAVAGLIVACFGCLGAVAVSMVPYPMWAMTKARSSATGICRELCETWEAVIGFYCADEASPYEQAMVMKNMRELNDQVDSLPGHISNSWWECAGMGSWQKARTLMMKLDAVARENYDRIVSCLDVCMGEEFEAGSAHMNLMKKMKAPLLKIVAESRDVFLICVEIACEGKMTDAQKTELETQVQDVKDAVAAATKAFHDTKTALNLNEVTLDMADEHAFCLSVCAFGRITCDYAEDLINDKNGTKPIPNLADGSGIMGTFDSAVIFDARHSNSALRNACSILIAFAIGYFGYGKVLLSENASIASTTCILLSSAVGSAIAKNLGRLQGVVLGTVVGKLIWAIAGWCTWWGYIALCAALFGWNLLCLYVYYDSPKYGGIACLLAAFGSGNFLVGCTDPLTATFDPAGPYYEIINVVISIGVMIFVDMLLAPGRASDMCCQTYMDAFKNLRKSLDELFDPSEPNVRVHTGKLGGLISGARALGSEAYEEPRYWRLGWKNDLFQEACDTLSNLRVTMTAMEYSVTEGGKAGGEKTKIFMMVLNKPQFQTIKTALYEKLDLMEKLAGIFAHETSAAFPALSDPRCQQDFKSDMEKSLKEVLKDVNKAIAKAKEETLENDQACQVSFCLSGFLMMMDQIESLQNAVLRA